MRSSLLDSLLDTARVNVARGNPAVAIFETGLVTDANGIVAAENPGVGHRPSDEALDAMKSAIPSQPYRIAGVAIASVTQPHADLPAVVWDWRDAIEATRVIARTIGQDVNVVQAERAPFHPGRCAEIAVGETVIGYAGELAPKVCQAFELPARSIAFEIDADALIDSRGSEPIQVAPVATYPAAKEDVALVIDSDVSAYEVEQVVREAAGDILEDLRIFDVYTGDQIPDGKKSLAFALRLRAQDHTLTAEETASVRNRILKQTRATFGAELRG